MVSRSSFRSVGPCRSCDGRGGIREGSTLLACSRCMGTGRYRGFKVGHVFDIDQTEGDPIEDLDALSPELLTGETPPELWDALVGHAHAAGFEVVRVRKATENGYCNLTAKIGVRPDVDELQAVKTLVHELAHAAYHSKPPSGSPVLISSAPGGVGSRSW